MKTLLLFVVSLPLLAQLHVPSTPQPGEKVVPYRGTVVDVATGLPIPGVTVDLRTSIDFTKLDFTQQGRLFAAKSGPKGEFAIDAIAGDFLLTTTLEGYELDDTIVRNIKLADSASSVTIRMIRGSMVSGIVEDEDGKPVGGIVVQLINPVSASRSVALRKVTGPDGRFSFPTVPPASYFMRGSIDPAIARTASRESLPAYAETYYPSTTDSLGAAQFSVYSGVDLPNLRLRMRKGEFYTVSGKVIDRENNTNPSLAVRVTRVADPRLSLPRPVGEPSLQSPIAADGTFRIPRIPPGRYTASVQTELSRLVLPLGSTPVTVTDRDEDNIQVVVTPAADFAGKVVFGDGKYHPGGWQVILRGNTPAGFIDTPLTLSADGAFSAKGIPAGKLQFSFTGPSRAAASKIEIAGRTFEGSKFDFSPPGSTSVVITASETGATIEGKLEGTLEPGKKVTGVGSYAMLDGLTDELPVSRALALAADGSFSFKNLEPGKYLVCAWTDQPSDVNTLLMSGSAPVQRLQQACAAVTLKPEGSETVRVKQTSIAEVTR